MARLIYTAFMSVDGYFEDEGGRFDWAMPDAEVHAFINDLVRPVGTHLYGRAMYETMAVWQTVGLEPGEPGEPGGPAEERDFAEVWRGSDKVVFSRTLEDVWTPRTRLVREFDPAAVAELKDAADHDLGIGGPGLAHAAFAAGLVDEVHLFPFPVVVGGGKPALPRDLRVDLTLLDERRFESGVVYQRYATR